MRIISISPTKIATRLLGCVAIALIIGCAGPGPSLKSLNQREAKIEVWPDGTMFVHGKQAAIEDLAKIIKASSTAPSDPIFIRLNDDIDSLEMQNIRHRINDQMIRCGHYKYAYFSAPQASVSILDKKTGTYSTVKQAGIIKATSGESMHREIDRMKAEAKAYEDGTYISDALNLNADKNNTMIESASDALNHEARDLSDTELKRLSSNRKIVAATKRETLNVKESSNTTTTTSSEENMRKAYLRQQRRVKNNALTR